MFKSRAEEDRIFKEACNGYGFFEIEQKADGIFCKGCLVVHKRPTKMYDNGAGEVLCRFQVIHLYNPEDCA